MIENEYTRQEDYYKQQMADLEEEKEQLQVSNLVSCVTILNFKKNFSVTLFAHLKLFRFLFVFLTERINVKSGGKQACLIVLGRRYEGNERAQKPGMERRC